MISLKKKTKSKKTPSRKRKASTSKSLTTSKKRKATSEKDDKIQISPEHVESILGIVAEEDPLLWAVKLDTGKSVKMEGKDLVRLVPLKFLQFVEENVTKNLKTSE